MRLSVVCFLVLLLCGVSMPVSAQFCADSINKSQFKSKQRKLKGRIKRLKLRLKTTELADAQGERIRQRLARTGRRRLANKQCFCNHLKADQLLSLRGRIGSFCQDQLTPEKPVVVTPPAPPVEQPIPGFCGNITEPAPIFTAPAYSFSETYIGRSQLGITSLSSVGHNFTVLSAELSGDLSFTLENKEELLAGSELCLADLKLSFTPRTAGLLYANLHLEVTDAIGREHKLSLVLQGAAAEISDENCDWQPEIIDLNARANQQNKKINEYLTASLDSVFPPLGNTEMRAVFSEFSGNRVQWANNPIQNNFSLTGVNWGSAQAGTLISGRYVLQAEHYKNSKLTFYDRAGNAYPRTIVARKNISQLLGFNNAVTDVSLGKLNSCLPAQITRYALPAVIESANVAAEQISESEMLITHWKRGRREISAARSRSRGYTTGIVSLGSKNSEIIEAFSSFPESGDSGHPAFVLAGEDLVLVGMHHYGGGVGINGHYLGAAPIQQTILAEIKKYEDAAK